MRVRSIRTSTRHELYTATPVGGACIYGSNTASGTQRHQQTIMAKLTYTPCSNMLCGVKANTAEAAMPQKRHDVKNALEKQTRPDDGGFLVARARDSVRLMTFL
jgi:hypothetical protein